MSCAKISEQIQCPYDEFISSDYCSPLFTLDNNNTADDVVRWESIKTIFILNPFKTYTEKLRIEDNKSLDESPV